MLEADIRLHLSRLDLEADFSAGPGEVVALLGPNGAGKSTVLRALAGLLRLAGGRIELDGKVLDQPAEHVFVPPERRAVAMMFQDYLLFPHLSALENAAFGLRARGQDRRAARAAAAAELDRLGVGGVAAARPGAMSGGQQQRVALARALITGPRLLLLDEPLAALDVSTKAEVRRLLRSALRGTRAAHLLVTHDLLDAVALADRMLVLEHGTIVQTGTPAEVTARPRSGYVADLTGVTLLRGTAAGPRLQVEGGGELVTTASLTGPVLAVVPPSAVAVHRERPEAAAANLWRGEIGAVDLLGDRVRVRVEGPVALTAEVPPAAVKGLRLDDGGPLWASIDPAAVTVYR
jgi:molybdate transport system ATP-binding protein